MNLKTIAAASVIALLPMASFAAVDVDVTSNDGVGADAATMIGTLTGQDNTANLIAVAGPAGAFAWNMTIQGIVGDADTGATIDFDFTLGQSADLTLFSTQIPPGNLTDLTIELIQGGSAIGTLTPGANFGGMLQSIAAAAGDVTVRATWDALAGPFGEVDVDFVLMAENFGDNDIPLPASALLLIGALGGLGVLARRKA